MKQNAVRVFAGLCAGAALLACATAQAQTPEEFYKGKTVTMVVGAGTGGGYDTIARVVVRHLAGHIPGKPTVIVQNMPGAGGLRAPNYLYSVAEKTGLTIGLIQFSMPFEPMIGNKNAKFDPRKFGWLGSPNVETGVLAVWHTAPAVTLDDLRKKEITVGVEAIASNPALSARMLMETLGIKLRLVAGYKGSNAVMLAMETGEVASFPHVYNSLMSTRGHWVRDRKVLTPVKWGPYNEPGLPGVPYAQDIVTDPVKKAVLQGVSAALALGRPFIAPPGLPADRLKALQRAFADTFADKAFAEDTKKIGFTALQPQTGEALEKVVRETYDMPQNVKDILRYVYTGVK
ncbi:MAG: Bug family tripartite tricarboxylate transporter substrate binding protein [Beijerinckiaceae bacterium]